VPTEQEIFDASLQEVKEDKMLQLRLFKQMIISLEAKGDCRYSYHRLADALFGENELDKVSADRRL